MDNFDRFKSYSVDEDQKYRLDKLAIKFSTLLNNINDIVPESREKSLMLTKLEEACMWGAKAISRENTENGPTFM